MEDTLYVVMPAYNEEANIEQTIRSWYSVLDGKNENSRLVVADSGSLDNTHKILLSLQNEFPKLEVLNDTGRYHGEKVIALYDYAIKSIKDGGGISFRLILMVRQIRLNLMHFGIYAKNMTAFLDTALLEETASRELLLKKLCAYC